MKELIDIYDADLNHIGVEDISLVHLNGLWHQTFHLWLISPKSGGKILYQWRSESVSNFPDKLDVSAAGHLQAGETVGDGIREAEEELGLSISPDSIYSLGYRVEVSDHENNQKNREFQAVHLALVNIDFQDLSPAVEEVSGIYWVSIKDGMELFIGNRDNIICEGMYYDEQSESWNFHSLNLTRKHFLPRIQKYYLTIHIMAERLLSGSNILAIS